MVNWLVRVFLQFQVVVYRFDCAKSGILDAQGRVSSINISKRRFMKVNGHSQCEINFTFFFFQRPSSCTAVTIKDSGGDWSIHDNGNDR